MELINEYKIDLSCKVIPIQSLKVEKNYCIIEFYEPMDHLPNNLKPFDNMKLSKMFTTKTFYKKFRKQENDLGCYVLFSDGYELWTPTNKNIDENVLMAMRNVELEYLQDDVEDLKDENKKLKDALEKIKKCVEFYTSED